ncbi:MAG: DUF4164 domain-containing protein [Proteobacteria bacterium]|nr:DUF4164 domain-containing protein [Pseudomonadota bacterium]
MTAAIGTRDFRTQDDNEPAAPAAAGPRVTGEGSLDIAVKRLARALDGLDAAVERRREADRNEDTLAAQVQMLGVDRARLADRLDGEAALARQLKDANRDIAERLDRAIVEIQSLLSEDS